ncbi:hypothetical protein INT43_003601 [Umbelopsis isabellina]|uniref:Uncharacterized protein n=1 Tax=Mortierella isabellina TaxID=91625 RepID=A0A8H7PU04_MORIS|nr:hypothetical protein INT43_003601 [Umbelopsis isabellina]
MTRSQTSRKKFIFYCHLCKRTFKERHRWFSHLAKKEGLDISNDLSDEEHAEILKRTKEKAKGMSGDIWICFSCDSLEKSEGDLRVHLQDMHNVPYLSNDDYSQQEIPCDDSDLENLIVSEFTEEEHDPGEVPEFEAYDDDDDDDECVTNVEKDFLSKRVNDIQRHLTKKSDLLNPFKYFVFDLTGRHCGTKACLMDMYKKLQKDLWSKISYERHQMNDRQRAILMNMMNISCEDDIDQGLAHIAYLSNAELSKCRSHLSESTHIMANIASYFTILEPKNRKWSGQWGETSLKASADRRNWDVDPSEKSRIGQKTDYILNYLGMGVDAELFIGEVSGGLPKACNGKAWYDYLIKLVLGARDCLLRLQDYWGKDDDRVFYFFQVHGFRFTLYAMDNYDGYWRVIMVDECYLSRSDDDVARRADLYCILRGVFKTIEEQALKLNMLGYNDVNGSKRKMVYDDRTIVKSPKSY